MLDGFLCADDIGRCCVVHDDRLNKGLEINQLTIRSVEAYKLFALGLLEGIFNLSFNFRKNYHIYTKYFFF